MTQLGDDIISALGSAQTLLLVPAMTCLMCSPRRMQLSAPCSPRWANSARRPRMR